MNQFFRVNEALKEALVEAGVEGNGQHNAISQQVVQAVNYPDTRTRQIQTNPLVHTRSRYKNVTSYLTTIPESIVSEKEQKETYKEQKLPTAKKLESGVVTNLKVYKDADGNTKALTVFFQDYIYSMWLPPESKQYLYGFSISSSEDNFLGLFTKESRQQTAEESVRGLTIREHSWDEITERKLSYKYYVAKKFVTGLDIERVFTNLQNTGSFVGQSVRRPRNVYDVLAVQSRFKPVKAAVHEILLAASEKYRVFKQEVFSLDRYYSADLTRYFQVFNNKKLPGLSFQEIVSQTFNSALVWNDLKVLLTEEESAAVGIRYLDVPLRIDSKALRFIKEELLLSYNVYQLTEGSKDVIDIRDIKAPLLRIKKLLLSILQVLQKPQALPGKDRHTVAAELDDYVEVLVYGYLSLTGNVFRSLYSDNWYERNLQQWPEGKWDYIKPLYLAYLKELCETKTPATSDCYYQTETAELLLWGTDKTIIVGEQIRQFNHLINCWGCPKIKSLGLGESKTFKEYIQHIHDNTQGKLRSFKTPPVLIQKPLDITKDGVKFRVEEFDDLTKFNVYHPTRTATNLKGYQRNFKGLDSTHVVINFIVDKYYCKSVVLELTKNKLVYRLQCINYEVVTGLNWGLTDDILKEIIGG